MSFFDLTNLDSYNTVGIDFDLTLVNGPASTHLQQWVKDNPEKNKWIITFRNGKHLATMNDELNEVGLTSDHFRGVISLPIGLFREYSSVEPVLKYRTRNPGKFHRFLKNNKITEELVDQKLNNFLDWKGKMCHEIGAEVLIDDMEKYVVNGCLKYNILYVDSLKIRV